MIYWNTNTRYVLLYNTSYVIHIYYIILFVFSFNIFINEILMEVEGGDIYEIYWVLS